MSAAPASRGLRWFQALTGEEGLLPGGLRTVRAADARIGAELARCLAVVPDAANRFPRARAGELGIDEAWALAQQVRRTLAEHSVRLRGRCWRSSTLPARPTDAAKSCSAFTWRARPRSTPTPARAWRATR